jgi:hypothetical protein
MPRTVQRRVTTPEPEPEASTTPRLLPSELAGEPVRGACGWCITRDHDQCVNRTMTTKYVTCKCPCPKA